MGSAIKKIYKKPKITLPIGIGIACAVLLSYKSRKPSASTKEISSRINLNNTPVLNDLQQDSFNDDEEYANKSVTVVSKSYRIDQLVKCIYIFYSHQFYRDLIFLILKLLFKYCKFRLILLVMITQKQHQEIVNVIQNTSFYHYINMNNHNKSIFLYFTLLERRMAKKNNQTNKYLNYFLNYNDEIEIILERAQAEILFRLEIHKDLFEESILTLMERGYYQQLFMLSSSIKQKIKYSATKYNNILREKIPSKKKISKRQFQDIIKYNIQLLGQTPEPQLLTNMIQKLKNSTETLELIPTAIKCIIQDFIFEKFGIEEEDQIRYLSQIGIKKQKKQFKQNLLENTYDLELEKLLKQIDQAIRDFCIKHGVNGIDGIPDFINQQE